MATKREWDRVIGHWTRLSSGKRRKNEDIGANDCAFCKRYLDRHNCHGCPIFEETRFYCCINTPYDNAENYVNRSSSDTPLDEPEFMRLAKKELDFLLEIRKKVRGD